MMKAVILAAGQGIRLGRITENIPKCLLKINNKTILEHQIQSLQKAGIKDITIVTGFQHEKIKNHIKARCRFIVNRYFEFTNSIFSLWMARESLAGHDFIMLNGDVIYDEELIVDFVKDGQKTACLVDNTKLFNEEEYQIAVDSDQSICEYGLDVNAENSVGESAQLLKVSAEDSQLFLSEIDELVRHGDVDRFPSFAYQILIEDSKLFAVYTNGAQWFEIDTIEDYLACAKALEQPSLMV